MTKLLIFIFALFFAQIGFTQAIEKQTNSLLQVLHTTQSDSLSIEIYRQLAQLNLYSQPQQSVQYCRKGIKLGKTIGHHLAIADLYTQMFNAQLYFGAQADTLISTIQRYEKHVNTHLSEEDLVNVYWIYALYYSNIKQTDHTIEAYIKALEIAEKYHHDNNVKGALIGNIGNVFLRQGKYKEALTYLEKSLGLIDDDIGMGETFLHLGLIHFHEQDYEEALHSFRKSYQFNQKGKDTKGMVLALIEEGKYYDHFQKFRKANYIYQKAYKLVKNNNIGSLLPSIFITLAEHHQKRENDSAAINYGEQALAEIELQRNYDDLAKTYTLLHQSYAKLGYYREAYEIRGKEMVYKDSVNSSELLTNVEALKTEYEVEQKEIENQLLKAQAASNEKTIQSRNITAIALLLGFLLMLSWVVTVVRINRQKQQYNEQLELTVSDRTAKLEKANKELVQVNYELKTFNHIASHDIKEPIRNIGSHIGLIYRSLPKEYQPEIKEYFETIRNSTTQLYTVVEDFSRYTQLSKNDDVIVKHVDLNGIVDHLELSMSDQIEKKNAQIVNHGLLHVETNASMIYIILKKIIENGLKFNESPQPQVSLRTKSHDQYIEIHIEDNGIGIDPAYQEQVFEMFKRLHHRKKFEGSGMGLAIVKLL
ncbi:MAG: tetratricopeptide repeat protein, partial [Bacteroidota bacterium]